MNRSGWAIVPGMAETPDEALIALLRQRGFTFDAGRAAALLPLAGSLLGRLARIGETLPRDAAPPPAGLIEDLVR
jgi:hypothetical protein